MIHTYRKKSLKEFTRILTSITLFNGSGSLRWFQVPDVAQTFTFSSSLVFNNAAIFNVSIHLEQLRNGLTSQYVKTTKSSMC